MFAELVRHPVEDGLPRSTLVCLHWRDGESDHTHSKQNMEISLSSLSIIIKESLGIDFFGEKFRLSGINQTHVSKVS